MFAAIASEVHVYKTAKKQQAANEVLDTAEKTLVDMSQSLDTS